MTTGAKPVSESPHLFAEPGAEVMEFSAPAAYEAMFSDALLDHDRVVIEEWTSVGMSRELPSTRQILERIAEGVHEDVGMEGAEDSINRAFADPEVVAAFEAARAVLAAKLDDGYRQADTKIADHVVTWDDNDEPLLDGQPMYVQRAALAEIVEISEELGLYGDSEGGQP